VLFACTPDSPQEPVDVTQECSALLQQRAGKFIKQKILPARQDVAEFPEGTIRFVALVDQNNGDLYIEGVADTAAMASKAVRDGMVKVATCTHKGLPYTYVTVKIAAETL
jgi:hypothetical protein